MTTSQKNTNCESNNQSTTFGGCNKGKYVSPSALFIWNMYLLKKIRYPNLIFKINRELQKLYLQDHKKKNIIIINSIEKCKYKTIYEYYFSALSCQMTLFSYDLDLDLHFIIYDYYDKIKGYSTVVAIC